jgi:hypothetical protein
MTCTESGFYACSPNEVPRPVEWSRACVSYRINEVGTQNISDAEPGLSAELERAVTDSFDTWDDVECSRMELVYDGITELTAAEFNQRSGAQNLNLVVWRDENWGAVASRQTFALTSVSYNPNTGEIADADIEINAQWYPISTSDPVEDGHIDLRNTLVHEVGHFVGLDHTAVREATMYASADIGETNKRTLHEDDIEGICHIYPATDESGDLCEKGPEAVPGLSVWLKADEGVTLAGGAVETWADQSRAGNDATQSTLSSRPKLVNNAIGGKRSIKFDGADDFLTLPPGFSDFNAGMTVFVVAHPTSMTDEATFFDLGNAEAADNITFGREAASSTLALRVYSASHASSILGEETIKENRFQLFEAVQQPSGSAELFKNGESVKVGSLEVPTNTNRSRNFIAKSNWESRSFFEGEIAEILIFNKAISAEDRQAMELYLAQKYNLPHPAIEPGDGGNGGGGCCATTAAPAPRSFTWLLAAMGFLLLAGARSGRSRTR